MTQNSSAATTASSEDSERHGLLARIIENWLTSANERQYQLPFCQVLAAEGETVLYVSTHGPWEKGKDIVTRTAQGEIRAYQLKANNIGLNEWRDIHGEVNNLVELAIEHPSVGIAHKFSAYLVTNGELTDPVLEQVRVANVSWQGRGITNTLHVIQKGELLERFRASHGAYLPRELSDFRTFLELILRDGTFVADKARAAQLLEGVLPARENASSLDVERGAASAVLLAAYISGAAHKVANHWAQFEYWVVAAAYILRLAEKYTTAEKYWQASFNICELSAERAIEALISECKERTDLVEGTPLTDGHTYASRVTVLAGLFAAAALRKRIMHQPFSDSNFVFEFIQKHLKNGVMWGESAVPYLVLVALEADCQCRPAMSEQLLIQLLSEIASNNKSGGEGSGIPNVYYSPEEAIRFNTGLDNLNSETFVGNSYTIGPLVDMLARRWRRQALASLWFSITRIALATYAPDCSAEWFRWKSSEGALETRCVPEPQSWAELVNDAENLGYDGLPKTLIARPEFAVWFILVYPHRFTRRLARLVESAVLSC